MISGMEIYSILVSEILKYYEDVEDINGNDYDEFVSAWNITDGVLINDTVTARFDCFAE